MVSGQDDSASAESRAGWRGRASFRRRGSILVIVVGTLALLAVLMLVYVSVGRQDARTKAAASTRERLDDVPQQFADYLADQIIAADALATYYDDRRLESGRPDVPDDEPALMREAFDYGSTDWTRRSDTLDRLTAFNPVGTYVREREPTPDPPSRDNPDPEYSGDTPFRLQPSDPWLASNEPTWLGHVGWSGNDARGNDLTEPDLAPYGLELAGAKKDWLHISNVAPDGKFVNLYNLAPKMGRQRVGNLNALPGFGTDIGDFGLMPRLSEGLALLSGRDNHSDADEPDTDPSATAWGSSVGAQDRFRPAFWDSWQRGAFRLAQENRTGIDGGDPNYLPYQWADADGDGMFDSRWMQLADSRAFDASNNPGDVLNLLDTDGKYRYFFATRIIDASGMINVNTATDLAAAPTATNPVGLTPADIDLRRLLTLHDVYDGFRFAPGAFDQGGVFNRGAGYDGIINEPASPSPTAPDQGFAPGDYRPTGRPTIPPPGPSSRPNSAREGYNAIRAYSTGSMAYTSLRLSLAAGLPMPLESAAGTGTEREYRGMALFTQFPGVVFGQGARDPRDPLARRLWDFVPGPEGADPDTADRSLQIFPTARLLGATDKFNVHSPLPFTPLFDQGEGFYASLARRRAEHYSRQSRASQGSLAEVGVNDNGELVSQFRSMGSFGIDDLSELLTYRASNDIGVLSSLERVLGGRDRAPFDLPVSDVPADTPDPRRFDPLRSNRGPELELARDVYRRDGDVEQQVGPDGRADGRARLQLDADIRQRLTTVSGARSLFTGRGSDGGGVSFDTIEAAEVKTNASALLSDYVAAPGGSQGLFAMNAIFGTYADALLPYSNLPRAWQRARDTETREFAQFKTLSYGHDGAAPALIAAAHMTANLADLTDADQVPSSWTVILNDDARGALTAAEREFPSWRSGRRLDLRTLAPERLPGDTTRDQRVAEALTVYGIEPQPFVSAVATFTVYADKDEYEDDPPSEDEVSFDARLTRDNDEFLYRVVAFRLHNPFGVDITLGDPAGAIDDSSIANSAQAAATKRFMRDVDLGDPAMYQLDRQRDFYYIKFGGRTFLLTGIEERVRHLSSSDARLNRGSYEPGNPVVDDWNVGAATEFDPETQRRRGAPLTIKAGGTIVAYSLSQMPRYIHARVGAANFSSPAPAPRDEVRRLIERQLRLNWSSETQCVWIPEIDSGRSGSTGRLGTLDQGDRRCSGATYNPGIFRPWQSETRALGQLLQPNNAGTPIDPSFRNLDADSCDRRLLDNTEVQLWRAIRSSGIDLATSDDRLEPGPVTLPTKIWDGSAPTADDQPLTQVNVFVRNIEENDQLVDRFRLPLKRPGDGSPVASYVDLDARLKVTGGTDAVPVEGSEDDAFREGLTLALWAAARRPQDPALDQPEGTIPAGAIGAFGLEAKPPEDISAPSEQDWQRLQWNRYVKQTLPWKEPGGGDPDPRRLRVSDFEETAPHGAATALTVRRWVTGWSADSDPQQRSSAVCRAIAASGTERLPAASPNAEQSPQGLDLDRALPAAVEGAYGELHAHALAGNAPAARARRPVAGSNPQRYEPLEIERFTSTFFVRDGRAGGTERSTLRVADLLLPMGIGPVYAPWTIARQPNNDAAGDPDLSLRWTTLGEALVTSMWEFNDDRTQPSNDPSTLLRPLPGAGGPRPRFDRGQLRLDDFAPFFNEDGDAEAVFNPLRDLRYFTQIPLALNILDMFSAGVVSDESVTRSVPGLININTAPLAVARCLPMLSPMTRPAASEVQTVTVAPEGVVPTQQPPGPGEQNDQWREWPPPFTLSLTRGSQRWTTEPIDVGASPSVVQAALEALPIVGRGNVSVTAGAPANQMDGWNRQLRDAYAGAHYVVTFTGALAMLNLPPMELEYGDVGVPVTPAPAAVRTAVDGSNERLGPAWWGEGSGIDQTVDLAATLVANRDKIEVPLRPQSWQFYNLVAGDQGNGGGIPLQSVRYPHVDIDDRPTDPSRSPDEVKSRAVETGIVALSETPGFQSLGALMTLRYRGENLRITSGQAYDYAKSMRTSIDYMGYPTNPVSIPLTGFQADNQSAIGIDSVLGGSALPTILSDFPDTPNVFEPDPIRPGDFVGTDGMPNEYKEKLAIANAVVNTTTTRSDYFIAWFLVHGYQQSDVENLALTDAITPTIARRFVMVVDRSNVVKRGDKPRVLLFKEVPVSGR